MEAASAVTEQEKVFLEFLIDFIIETNPDSLTTNLAKVSKKIQDDFPADHELNKYRKSFRNLKDCVNNPGANQVFELDGTSFKFLHPDKIAAAHGAGTLTETAWARYQAGRSSYL